MIIPPRARARGSLARGSLTNRGRHHLPHGVLSTMAPKLERLGIPIPRVQGVLETLNDSPRDHRDPHFDRRSSPTILLMQRSVDCQQPPTDATPTLEATSTE